MTMGTVLRRLGRLKRDRRGIALIEFAFAVPILAILFVGGYQTMDAVSAYRKVTTTVRTLADLTTQSTSTTQAGAQQFLAASQQVMVPYSTSNAVLRISQVKIDITGKSTIDWSQAVNGTGYTKGSTVPLPVGLIVPGTYLIYAEINYQYLPGIASNMLGPIPLRDTLYMSPRNSASVPCADC
ncbi:TadE/TadG family type IV pilus assembly protein [Sphingomonas bacterium]|uniref:TadE/TadG family type IV pilus assembly protein n=1 Tax=Sphingomonas bacterium TaxID=1895847 RepID=UPI00157613A2|nr:TadE/TadG family type IV pilus assembly protein [Sphingomonas bacterium]